MEFIKRTGHSFKKTDIKTLFQQDADRFSKLSFSFNDTLFDLSKNIIDEGALKGLVALANECKLKEAINAMFNGELINETENRAVLHTALRNFSGKPVLFEGKNVMEDVLKVQRANEKFLQQNSQRRMERLYR